MNMHLTDEYWKNLLNLINHKGIIPVIGSELSTFVYDNNKKSIRDILATKIAKDLGVNTSNSNNVDKLTNTITSHLMSGGHCNEIYSKVRYYLTDLIESPAFEIPAHLEILAAIKSFDFFITTSFDPFLSMALEKVRNYQPPELGYGDYHPASDSDIPGNLPASFVYHLTGSYQKIPDFGVWEEDYIESMYQLMRNGIGDRPRLVNLLKQRSFLLIGSPFDNTLLRLFFRITKNQRFTDYFQGAQDQLAGKTLQEDDLIVLFFGGNKNPPRLISTEPQLFIEELERRWQERFGQNNRANFLNTISREMNNGAIFISYSHDDLDEVLVFAEQLTDTGLPIYLDKNRLTVGSDFSKHLETAVKRQASLFISIISRSTESDETRYVHKERKWAADNAVDGTIFYIPVLLDKSVEPRSLEPQIFAHLNHYILQEGKADSQLIDTLKNYHQIWQSNQVIHDV